MQTKEEHTILCIFLAFQMLHAIPTFFIERLKKSIDCKYFFLLSSELTTQYLNVYLNFDFFTASYNFTIVIERLTFKFFYFTYSCVWLTQLQQHNLKMHSNHIHWFLLTNKKTQFFYLFDSPLKKCWYFDWNHFPLMNRHAIQI